MILLVWMVMVNVLVYMLTLYKAQNNPIQFFLDKSEQSCMYVRTGCISMFGIDSQLVLQFTKRGRVIRKRKIQTTCQHHKVIIHRSPTCGSELQFVADTCIRKLFSQWKIQSYFIKIHSAIYFIFSKCFCFHSLPQISFFLHKTILLKLWRHKFSLFSKLIDIFCN